MLKVKELQEKSCIADETLANKYRIAGSAT